MLSISPQLEEPEPGFEISPNFGEIFRFRSVPGKNISVFSENFVLKIQNSKKFTEVCRNSPKFRNGIPFPPITGISPENEMVNPGQNHLLIKFSVSVISFMHIFSLARNPHSCHFSSTAASSTRFF